VSAPALRLSGLEVRAGQTRLLGPVDLEVAAGEHVLLVGPSGSGKTTLLRAVAGLVRPAAGRVELFGQPASDGPRLTLQPERRELGLVFQGGALWPHLSARRTLEFVLRARGAARAEARRRAGELLERVELAGYEERMPGTLSGGEAQRLALARALAMDPRLLLLDEPLGPLDAELRGSLLARLGALQRDLGLTMLHVTHDPAEARAVASRTITLRDGRLVPAPAATGGPT
jgi:ABC-type Fe3+/spermidine/putrescine transport system ATPase subunit